MIRLKLQFGIFILFGFWALFAMANYSAGVAAYQRGDIEAALIAWEKVLDSSPQDVHPQERAETLYAVAMLFWLGQGVPQDTVAAASYLQQAAELNHPGAQSKLGYLYLIGQGVSVSNFEARKWLEMAALQGDADAQYNLAVVYRDGIGIEVDSDQAMRWFEEAAANGDPVSAEVIAEFKKSSSWPVSTEQSQPPTEISSTSSDQSTAQLTEAERASEFSPTEIVESRLVEPVSDPQVVEGSEPTVSSESVKYESKSDGGFNPQQSDGEVWILERDSEHYTIQIIALKNSDSMTRLINAHPQMAPFAVYLQGEEDSPLYVLVQGDYANIDEARSAQQQFPRSLARKNQLWIRRLEMVQDLIEQRRADLATVETKHGAN